MTHDQKVLAAFWKMYNNSSKDCLSYRIYDEEILVSDPNTGIREVARVEIYEEEPTGFKGFVNFCIGDAFRGREYLLVVVDDIKKDISHSAKIYDKVEIQRVRDTLKQVSEEIEARYKIEEEESLNSLL